LHRQIKTKTVYCSTCNTLVTGKIIRKKETFPNVKGKGSVTIISNVLQCTQCGEDICDMELDDDNLRRVYEKQERMMKKKHGRN
jgi:hypothetical protein